VAAVEHETDLIALAPREHEFAGFAEAPEFMVSGGHCFQCRLEHPQRIPVTVFEVFEPGDGFDQARLALDRFLQAQPVLLGGGQVEAENRQCADQQRRRGHDQEQLVERLALDHC
jgi:hypothetical protein